MVSKTDVAITGVAVAGTLGLASVLLLKSAHTHTQPLTSQTPAPNLAKLTLDSNVQTITTNGSVTFNGATQDSKGEPVAGVAVGIYQKGSSDPLSTAASVADGTFTFILSFPDAGKYPVFVQNGSIVSQSITINVAVLTSASLILGAGQQTEISPGDSVSFTGVAFDQNGNAFAGAEVTELQDSSPIAGGTTTTNEAGAFKFSVVFPSAGFYEIAASLAANGAKIQTKSVTIAAS